MTDYIMNDPKLTHDGRFVKQGFSNPESAPTGQLLSENARITQKASNVNGPLKFDGAVDLDAPYTGSDLPSDHFKAVSTDPGAEVTDPVPDPVEGDTV